MEIKNRQQYTAAVVRSIQIHSDPYLRKELLEIARAIDEYLDFNNLRYKPSE